MIEAFKVHDLEQRSDEWHKHRSNTLGASEISAVLGISPYTTSRQLWEIKTGRGKEKISNFAMQQGIAKEPEIRAFYEYYRGHNTKDLTITYPEWETASASLDAIYYNEESEEYGDVIAEFKYPSQKTVDEAQNGIVPPHYMAQVQWQLMISKAKRCDFVAYRGDDNYAVVEVFPAEEYQKMMLHKAKEFWRFVETDTAPPLKEGEHEEMCSDEFLEIEERLLRAKEELDVKTSNYNRIKKELVDACGHKNVKGDHFIVTERVHSRVDWNAVKEHLGVTKAEVESFKQPSAVSFEVRKKPTKKELQE